MKVEFDKIGQGCEVCVNKDKLCGGCERNPNLLKLKDRFVRIPKTPPALPIQDNDRRQASEMNRSVLSEWGIRAPARPVPPPAPSEQKPASADPKENILEG